MIALSGGCREADDICHLFRELAIIAQLEGLHPMRFETVRPADAAHGGRPDGGHLRQRARTPVSGMGRRLAGSHRYDLIDLAGRTEAGASAARSVFLNPRDPAIQESPSPESRSEERRVGEEGR